MPPTPIKAARSDNALYGKVAWRIIPLLFVCYIAAYLDRVNVGFAKLQLQSDVPQISDTVFGLGAGIFFLGYFVFEVPSNILMEKLGARLWIARIMITWGLVSTAMIFVNSSWIFYGLRLLLGFAEAGFFPGVILYLTYWFPSRRRGEMVALFMLAIALTGVIGAPLSGWILHQFSGRAGLKGWQMLFLLEGIPSIVLGIFVPLLLANGVRSARWLNAEEKQILEQNLRAEESHQEHLPFAEIFLNPRLLLFAVLYFCCAMGLYGTGFWIPQLIKNTGIKDPLDIGLLTAIPYTFGAVAMVILGRSSDRSGKRRLLFAMASLMGAVGIVISNLFRQDTLIAMIGLTIATMGILATFPLFWPMPTAMLAGTAAAAGIAWINSLGNLAGFFGPSIVGWFTDLTKRSDYGLYVVAGALVLGSFLVFGFVPRELGADKAS
ncbi:MAG: MFS transporter [Verrucomicrobia bacterium]|nr:MFS transporter [Verrucomicrobiota bacterium]MBV8377360.1 MFS transporter [Verrucomicrobiota bacterium]